MTHSLGRFFPYLLNAGRNPVVLLATIETPRSFILGKKVWMVARSNSGYILIK
jgi:hypothetical protein